ncbi:glucosamine 6-phosphate N-acetyltransferase-like, partial [Helianthus annuus]|uniref:glucosamine 6-phosphate N-acetyltransferase-like n=1 Tax=Helianthus annuus TaxID=4232 RepID=UPI001652BF73
FEKRFEEFKSYGDDHVICVIEDVASSKIVATGSVFIEKKFVRNCGKVGHIEDVVVDSSARGLQLGKKVVGFLADHARLTGCYKIFVMLIYIIVHLCFLTSVIKQGSRFYCFIGSSILKLHVKN